MWIIKIPPYSGRIKIKTTEHRTQESEKQKTRSFVGKSHSHTKTYDVAPVVLMRTITS
jgi:hypothetical protein